MFVLFLLSDTLSAHYLLYSDFTQLMFVVIALLILLVGFHLHYMMVRAGIIPMLVPRPVRREYIGLVDDILRHDEFMKLKDFFHHTNHIYDHVVRVSFISYAISKMFGMNYKAAARGGLLHDFFLYDWRERKASDESRALHGKEHPHIALENARMHFEVSELEADIIVKHMFPKTRHLPLYRESVVVSVADKISTIYEYYCHFLRRNR